MASEAPPDTTQRPGAVSPPRTPADSAAARARADSTRRDSLARAGPKKYVITDTTYVVDLDSSERVRDFLYVRHDSPVVQLFPERTYPLYAANHDVAYRRELSFDSTGSSVIVRETVGGVDMKVPVEVPLKEYIAGKRKYDLRQLIASEARKPKTLLARNDLGDILGNITKISIPVPPNPLFSIFGKNEINLSVTGAVDIKAGFRSTKSDLTTLSVLDQVRNEPDFNQEVQVNVNGTIGDKLSIAADWNTKRTFEYENQLKIKYTGYEDEVVQSVEAGNVSLQTQNSFIGSSQALFGVKALFQMGPFKLTTLASQKKGQIKEVAVTGGAQQIAFQMHPHEYATNHFWVDPAYIDRYEPYYQNEPPHVVPDSQIVEAEVWVTRQGLPDPNERQAVAYISLGPKSTDPTIDKGYPDNMRIGVTDTSGWVETGPFIKLDQSQYQLDGDGYLGELSLNINVGENQIVAIAYRIAGLPYRWGDLSRYVDKTKPLVLKMVKPKNLLSVGPSYTVAWKQMLKNVYPIPGIGRNLKKDGFTFDVFRQIAGQQDQNSIQNTPLLRVLGVDKFDASMNPNPDGVFDFRPERTVSVVRAEIIFPYLKPFSDGVVTGLGLKDATALSDSMDYFHELYDTTTTFAQQNPKDRYLMKGTATGEATSQFSIGFNVVEGSVQVILDGRTLVANVDYTVDYIVGQVVIKNERALVPGANMQIKYEQNDLFQLASKTLLGMRGELALNQNTTIGFTLMNLNQQSLSDKVRLGEEPSNNTIYGIDGGTTLNLPFLSRAIDKIPLLNTHEPSSLKISGEAAYMNPNSNTKTSTIPSDNGSGVAYIDDFEGARRTTPLGTTFIQWTDASPPADNSVASADSEKMLSKGKLIWYTRVPTDVHLTDVYPNKLVGNPANDQAPTLDLVYYPTKRGEYNYSMNIDSTLTRTKNWGGIMKTVSLSAVNLTKENINFIELWMRVDRAPPGAKMLIDLGEISEGVIPNGRLMSEALVLSSTPTADLLPGEDIGLDMMGDSTEQRVYHDLVVKYGNKEPGLAADPSGDDYFYDNTHITTDADFAGIDGTEGNENGPRGRIPDTEDLNGNTIVDLANSYFEYEVPLDTLPALRLRNPTRIVGGGFPYLPGHNEIGGNGPYYQFLIPVRDYTRKFGSPSTENIEYVRVLFENMTDTTKVRIADFNLVGNQWQKQIAAGQSADSLFDVGVVGIEQNPDYSSPPGVQREQDHTQPDYNVRANEQSLLISLKGVPAGQSREAVKFYTYKSLDVFSYKTMKMFVHGDPGFRYVDQHNYDAEVYFRFGLDSLNYYEYRVPVRPGWDPLNEMVISFKDLTAIKQGRDSVQLVSKPIPVPGRPGAEYRVLGNPSLTNIAYLAIGISNPLGKGVPKPLKGDVWFDELRLIDPDNTPGWAWRTDVQLKLADLGTLSFNYSRVDPYFHTLETTVGSRQLSTNWAMNASLQLEKFFPAEWAGTSIPVSYSHTLSLINPKYLPNSDVDVNSAAGETRQFDLSKHFSLQYADSDANALVYKSQTERVSDTYAAPALHIALPSQAWYIRDTFNKLSFGINYTKSRERSPAVVYHNSWAWQVHITYAVTLPPDYYVMPFKNLFDGIWLLDEYKNLKLYFPPGGLNWSVAGNRSRDVSLQQVADATEITSRQFAASRAMGFPWKLTEGGLTNLSGDYSLSVESSLLGMELDRNQQQRHFSKILGSIFFSDHLINFGEDTRYSQRNTFNTKPALPNILNIKKYLDVSGGYSVDYNWQNSLTAGDLGKSVQFSNNINLQMNLKLKQLFDPLFEDKSAPGAPSGAPSPGGQPMPRGRGRSETAAPAADTSAAPSDTTRPKPSGPSKTVQQLRNLIKVFLKIPFLDYDNVNITFTQTNQAQNSGVIGAGGFINFWGRMPFFQESDPNDGPSRLYQLGLISDPSGHLTNFGIRSHFPFFGWDVVPGVRAAGGQLVNTYNESNRLSFKTSRDLWEGARLDLSWNVGWNYSRTQNLMTDSGAANVPVLSNQSITGSVDRSFLTFPNVLFLGMFKTSLEEVSKRYSALKNNGDSSMTDDAKLSQAFEQGFEALPILKKLFGQYYPRVNWSFRWDGLEKLPLFQGFVTKLSLDHSYNSNYTRQFENTPGGGGERTDGQHVAYGFNPLLGANFTFKELLKGSFGMNLKYNTSTSYDLSVASRNIVETLSQEISVTASYSRKGFEIPFFGLALSNDVDLSLSYAVTKNSRITYDVSQLDVSVLGVPLEGSTRTVIEPRIKYVLSQRVTASVYYTYTRIAPDLAGSTIPGSTTNEAGLDLHIAIQ